MRGISPTPRVDNFDQIILTAQRKERPDPSQTQTQTLRSIATGRTELNPLNRPPDHYSHYLPKQTHEPADILFNSMSIDVAEALSEAARKGILSSPNIRERFWPTKPPDSTAGTPPAPGPHSPDDRRRIPG